ncbi:hypothetical protein AVEN_129100-1 [Araneus ventricosus]|uniref:Uncharacterized protein n=1 Tax=Araneus ventricosus TaxID=182803 RepID=A0A4Y2V6G9_ARAVE|nr:hypothetical protein AVEN_129100-1 [Araneus ventricosus]
MFFNHCNLSGTVGVWKCQERVNRHFVASQIAILVCSKVAASLHCKSARLTRQECKLAASYRKLRSHQATNLQQACHVKLIANIAKTEYEHNLGLEPATWHLLA